MPACWCRLFRTCYPHVRRSGEANFIPLFVRLQIRARNELAISTAWLFNQLRLGLLCLGLYLDCHSLRLDPIGYALRLR